MAAPQWQIRFDNGHQQRYLPDRESVLRYVLAVGPGAASQRFEVFRESDPVRLADGTPGGRQFVLAEVIDLSQPGEASRLTSELAEIGTPPAPPGEPASRPDPRQPSTGQASTGQADARPPSPRTVIPLMPGVARPRGERRLAMQAAVMEVVGHLVLAAVPPERRSPLFGQARDLLSEAGWGLDELYEAATGDMARQTLFRALGLDG